MIFFMTIIVPSSNLSAELNHLQKQIFSEFKYIPTPFPLLITSINKNKPNRPTRKEISEIYPEELTLGGIRVSRNKLILNIKEKIPFHCDADLNFSNIINESGFILSTVEKENQKSMDSITCLQTDKISNFSLSCYEIDCKKAELFWNNMSWNKLWEVKKGKKKI